ncbi:MAG: hypothetical protein IKU60_05285 [Clostridia bacterium]|nr:hypothetical protein [Clostridia bacterium]
MKNTIRMISLILAMIFVISLCPAVSMADAEDYDESLLLWYKFDEIDGTVAKDSSGNGFDGAVMGGAEWLSTDGKGVALQLDNTVNAGRYVEVPIEVMKNVPADFTISTWVKVTDYPEWGRILDYGKSTSDVMYWLADSYMFKMDKSNDKVVQPPANGTLSQFRVGCPLSVLWPEGYSEPRWQHVTVTRKGQITTLWINGIKWSSATYTTSNPRFAEDYKFYIGKSVWDSDPYASMDIKDFRLYNRALSVSEITSVMEYGEWADDVQVHYAMDTVDLSDITQVTENLYLPVKVNDRVNVEWSSDSEYLKTNAYVGAVKRPEAGEDPVEVTLTGTFSYNDYEESCDYTVTILPKDEDAVEYTLTVDTENILHAMSPTMYGLFFEDLSMAGDGGLYAELLRNTCFHDSDTNIPYWHLYTSEGASGSMGLNKTNNLNDVQYQHLKLNITKMPEGGHVGIRNEGYNGMEFETGKEYTLTFFARTDNFKGSVSAVLLSATGEIISNPVAVNKLTDEWTEYTLTLTPSEYAAQGEMALYCQGGPGTVYFDVVSLFPETYKDHKLRIDMAQYLADLNPTFLRFPGGCYVEGKTMDDAFRWKNTLYNKEDRAGHNSLWNYRVTDGLGYYEFLVLSEDLGAEPLYVCGVGIAHEDNEDWEYWINDVLDAIEFANGDVTTKWGAVRAEMGHPEPFNLKYVEIGNEANHQYTRYEERYQDFYDAIREKYPNINLIADCNIPGNTIDIVDEHYYKKSEWFMENAYMYDNYDRNGYKVYVGEYGVHRYHGLQNLNAALGEAAFMTGMERNSDVVTMSSYSELFANLNHQNWNATSAFFDSSRLYATPSYYAQKMFAEKVGDVVLPSALDASDGTFNVKITGGVGLGTWNTNATFSDIKVTSNTDGSVLFEGNSDTDGDWSKAAGTWTVENGVINQSTIAGDCRIWLDGKDWNNYTYEVTARKNSGKEGVLLILGHEDSDNFYYVNLGGWTNTKSAIERTVDGTKSTVSATVPGEFEQNRDYKIKAVVNNNNIKVYVDGEIMFDYWCNGSAECPLYYVAQRDNSTGDIILKVVNTANEDYHVNIDLKGAEGVLSEAEATIMTADTKLCENSFDNPTNVAPVTIPVDGVSESFGYTFMRNSITVMTINADIPVVDKTALEAALCDIPDEEKYTPETWEHYASALGWAEEVFAKEDATQTEVNNALKALEGAKALLVTAEEEIDVPEILASFTFDEEIGTGEGFDGGYAQAKGTYSLTERGEGKALKLNGSGQFLTVTTTEGESLLKGVKEFTVTYLAKPAASTSYNWGFYSARDASLQSYTHEHYIGLLDQKGTLRAERFNGGSRPAIARATVGSGKWYHVTGVFTENESIIYVNGKEVARETSPFTPTQILGNDSIFQIGKANWDSGEFFGGIIDDMNVYSRALTPTEIAMEAYRHSEIERPAIIINGVECENNAVVSVDATVTETFEENVAVIVGAYNNNELRKAGVSRTDASLEAGERTFLLNTPVDFSDSEEMKIFIWYGDGDFPNVPLSEAYVLSADKIN